MSNDCSVSKLCFGVKGVKTTERKQRKNALAFIFSHKFAHLATVIFKKYYFKGLKTRWGIIRNVVTNDHKTQFEL